MATMTRDNRQRLVSLPPQLIRECLPVAAEEGLSLGEWARSVLRRELARLATGKDVEATALPACVLCRLPIAAGDGVKNGLGKLVHEVCTKRKGRK